MLSIQVLQSSTAIATMTTEAKSTPPYNSAAWLMGTKVKPLKVGPAPYTSAKSGELVIRNRAVAINPVDRMKQEMGDVLYGWVKYPAVQGVDLAGEVVEVGQGVTSFQVGNRVLAMALGNEKELNTPAGNAFQHYTVVLEAVTTKIPDTMSFEAAATIPLGFSTAAAGLFQDDNLGLKTPTGTPQKTGQTLLVWGASTSVGCNAVQLAVAAGYDVIAVCGSQNFDLAKKLGAALTFDYKSQNVVKELKEAFSTRVSAGCISCGAGGPEACLEVFANVKGSRKVTFAAFPLPNPMPTSFVLPRFIWFMACWWTSWIFWSRLRGIRDTRIWGATPAWNGLAKTLFGDYLPKALAQGSFVPAPQHDVVGHGLEFVQEAYDTLGKGVSAKKLVVTL